MKEQIKKDFEVQIIGDIILNTSLAENALMMLKEENFSPSHRRAFKTIKELYTQGNLTDNNIITALSAAGIEKNIYIEAGAFSEDSALDYKTRALIDLDLSIKATELIKDYSGLAETSKTGLDILSDLKADAEKLIAGYDSGETGALLDEGSITEIFNQLRDNGKGRTGLIRSETIPTLNQITGGGFAPGNLITISGFLKQGKTSFALSLMLDFAIRGDVSCGLFSLEMSKAEVQKKIISNLCGVPYEELRRGEGMKETELNQLQTQARNLLNGKTLLISDKVQTIETLKANIRRWKAKYDVKVIFLDYIGLLSAGRMTKEENREQIVSYYSRSLKNIAKELDIVIFTLAQLNRGAAANVPTSGNLAESLAMARDSDYLFTIIKIINYPDARAKFPFIPDNTHFALTLTDSRHTEGGRSIALKMHNGSKMLELDTTHL